MGAGIGAGASGIDHNRVVSVGPWALVAWAKQKSQGGVAEPFVVSDVMGSTRAASDRRGVMRLSARASNQCSKSMFFPVILMPFSGTPVSCLGRRALVVSTSSVVASRGRGLPRSAWFRRHGDGLSDAPPQSGRLGERVGASARTNAAVTVERTTSSRLFDVSACRARLRSAHRAGLRVPRCAASVSEWWRARR
jgi:hypothetical protein